MSYDVKGNIIWLHGGEKKKMVFFFRFSFPCCKQSLETGSKSSCFPCCSPPPQLLASNATLTAFTLREGHICVSSQLGSVPYFIHLRSLPACRLQSGSLPSAHSICFSAVLGRKERWRAVHGGVGGRCSSLRRERRAKQSR